VELQRKGVHHAPKRDRRKTGFEKIQKGKKSKGSDRETKRNSPGGYLEGNEKTGLTALTMRDKRGGEKKLVGSGEECLDWDWAKNRSYA